MKHDEGASERAREFWRVRSKKYPSALDPDSIKKTDQIINIVKSRGISIKGAKVIDIGCGPGIFTIPLAKEAYHVTGIDFSAEMIERLNQTIKQYSIKNINTHCMAWHDADIDSLGFNKSFDLAWASMTMAIQSEADLLKMQATARDFCVYIGWGKKRENKLLSEVFSFHGIDLKPPDGASGTLSLVEGMGYSPESEFFDSSWTWKGNIDEAVEDLCAHVAMRGIEPKIEIVRELVSSKAVDGYIEHTTFAEKGVIIWKPD
ncbi:MAG: methyltransferase domain-containing protein [Nitrospirae bacterium]|nr:methyltransferase domain-containing protein [Nitrospirota bacterium]